MSHTDEIDDAIAELRRRFRLERVRDVITVLFYCAHTQAKLNNVVGFTTLVSINAVHSDSF